MDINHLKDLIDIIDKSKFQNFIFKFNELKIVITKDGLPTTVAFDKDEAVITNDEIFTKDIIIVSKYVGVINLLRNDNGSTITEGDIIKNGDKLGFIEYLNLNIDIYSPVNGFIKKICINNNQIVDYGKEMFIITEFKKDI